MVTRVWYSLLLAGTTGFARSLPAQERQVPATAPTIQVLHLTPAAIPGTRSPIASPTVVVGLNAEQKVLLARRALGPAGNTVHGAEAPIRLSAIMPRVPGRAWIHLNNGTMLSGDGPDGVFRLGGESSYLGMTLVFPQPSQPHLLQCLVQGKPGLATVVLRAGATALQTSLQPGWQQVGLLLYPEGAGQYGIEVVPGPHFLVEVKYCEITPLN